MVTTESIARRGDGRSDGDGGGGAFLLAQLGAHAASAFAVRIAETGLSPAQAGLLRAVAREPGCSQRHLAARLGLLPSTMVSVVDDLERRGLLRRERSLTDRRRYALELTQAGKAMMRRLGQLARAHQDDLLAALNATERAQLTELLSRIRDEQGLRPGVHPGYRELEPRRDA